MITRFVGAGYTGARVLKRMPGAVALGRSRSGDEQLDLDRDERLRFELPGEYAVIYSVPPAPDQPGDPKFDRLDALRLVAQYEDRFAKRRCLLLNAAGVGQD